MNDEDKRKIGKQIEAEWLARTNKTIDNERVKDSDRTIYTKDSPRIKTNTKQSTLDSPNNNSSKNDCQHWAMDSKPNPENDQQSIVYCIDCDYKIVIAKSKPLEPNPQDSIDWQMADYERRKSINSSEDKTTKK